MAYDATDFVVIETPVPVRDPKMITDPRERVAYLRDFLRELPPKRFNLRYMWSRYGRDTWSMRKTAAENHACGTAACVAGWAQALFEPAARTTGAPAAGELLGLDAGQRFMLFTPPGYKDRRSPSPVQAANVLDHYLATGEVDWSVTK